MTDQKNLILAIVLSIAILLGFQVFLAPPATPPDDAAGETASPLAPGQANEGAADALDSPGRAEPGVEPAVGTLDRPAALALSPRVRIATPRVHGSIALAGGRIDDLTLIDYRETIDPASPEIVLLSPRNADAPYYADFGWQGAEGTALPDAATLWTADAETLTPERPVTLSWDNGQGLLFQRVVAIDANYMFTVTDRVTSSAAEPVALVPYGRILRFGEPQTLGFFILHEGPYGVFDGTLEEYSYDDVEEETGSQVAHATTGGWLGFTDKYWLVALAPDQSVRVSGLFRHDEEGGGQTDRYMASFAREGTLTVAPGATVENTTHLFAGAKEVSLMGDYQEQVGIQRFDLTIDFGWFYFLTKPFFYVLQFIHGLVGNFGISILIFTIIIKALFFPLANKSYKSMSRMKALQPELLKLRERFADDRQKMNLEMMALYRREKVNPAAGCLPILVQIPVFFALYKVLFVTIEMRHAPFFGWIRDLSAPDPTSVFNLFGLIPWDPPGFLMLGVWPLIMGFTMWGQQKLNPAPPDPIQARIFMALPIIFTFFLAGFPAGLVIYWAWNNTLSIAQQWLIMRRMGVRPGGGLVAPKAEPKAEAVEAKAAEPAPAPALTPFRRNAQRPNNRPGSKTARK